MTGKEIFNKYLNIKDPTEKESEYISVLKTAFMLNSEKLFKLLEQADKEGKRIDLSYPIQAGTGFSEPDDIILI